MSLADVEILRDVRLPAGEPGVTLSADVYFPANARSVPAVVSIYPYRKDAGMGVQLESASRELARNGYASLLVDFRGTGSSDGAMRRPLVAEEVDDGIAAIEWAATQPWSSGAVGMWGHSYGALMTMRTASRRPAPLKAIVPVMGPLDPERDFVHPHGIRGGQLPIPVWAASNLAHQLLPPLIDFHSGEEQRRWQRRLREAEPWLVDLLRHGPGDPAWRQRAVDATTIETPALCVAGWRDVFVDAQIRAYEQIAGPKKLLVGPWMHTLPQDSPFEPVDFVALMVRWWDHWLRGAENGVMDEPAVTVYMQGADAGWRTFESWPAAGGGLALSTAADMTLKAPDERSSEHATVIAEYRPDPTIGTLSGLWGVAGDVVGMPLDQHEDDSRAASATGEPLADDLVIAGRPEVTVRLQAGTAERVRRLVVRMCEVDPQGRSTFITAGAAVGSEKVVLSPAAHRIRACHRLRVSVSDADFPRLWPLPDARPLRVTRIELQLPIAAVDAGAIARMPAPAQPGADPPPLGLWMEPQWQITRDPTHDGVEVVSGATALARTVGREHRFELRRECRAAVRHDRPEAAAIEGSVTYVAWLASGETVEVRVATRLTQHAAWARGEVCIDGTTTFSQVWDVPVPPGTA